jgi:hypothetical protein
MTGVVRAKIVASMELSANFLQITDICGTISRTRKYGKG